MKRLTFELNGVDFSPQINRYGYLFSYEPREGNNGGMMLDGSLTVDVLAWKAVIQLDCNAMKSSAQAAIMAMCATDYVTVTYYDTKENSNKTSVFIPSIGETKIGIIAPDNTKWFTGLTLTLRER